MIGAPCWLIEDIWGHWFQLPFDADPETKPLTTDASVTLFALYEDNGSFELTSIAYLGMWCYSHLHTI